MTFLATFREGRRKDGVSREWFTYMFDCLSRMPCLDSTDWTDRVVYDVLPTNLEGQGQGQNLWPTHRIIISCNGQGNDDHLDLVTTSERKTQVRVGLFAMVDVCLERRRVGRNHYIKKHAPFTKVAVERTKTFTFHEHFVWTYEFVLRYTEPYVDATLDAPALTFRDPPKCVFRICCHGLQQTTDDAYFADSFLCKVTDLLPPKWRTTCLT